MSIPVYMDVHVPSAVTEGLRARGVDVLTAQEDGRRTPRDPLLLDRATELERVLVTQDKDFLREASLRQREGRAFAGIIYAHQLGVRVGQMISELELICLAEDAEYMKNRVEWVPLRK